MARKPGKRSGRRIRNARVILLVVITVTLFGLTLSREIRTLARHVTETITITTVHTSARVKLAVLLNRINATTASIVSNEAEIVLVARMHEALRIVGKAIVVATTRLVPTALVLSLLLLRSTALLLLLVLMRAAIHAVLHHLVR